MTVFLPNFIIEEAEAIVENSEYIRLYRERELFIENSDLRNPADRMTCRAYGQLLENEMKIIISILRNSTPRIKWRRNFVEDFASLPVYERTYQRQTRYQIV